MIRHIRRWRWTDFADFRIEEIRRASNFRFNDKNYCFESSRQASQDEGTGNFQRNINWKEYSSQKSFILVRNRVVYFCVIVFSLVLGCRVIVRSGASKPGRRIWALARGLPAGLLCTCLMNSGLAQLINWERYFFLVVCTVCHLGWMNKRLGMHSFPRLEGFNKSSNEEDVWDFDFEWLWIIMIEFYDDDDLAWCEDKWLRLWCLIFNFLTVKKC